MTPASPELALVDPSLAAELRAGLREPPNCLDLPRPPAVAAPASPSRSGTPRRLVRYTLGALAAWAVLVVGPGAGAPMVPAPFLEPLPDRLPVGIDPAAGEEPLGAADSSLSGEPDPEVDRAATQSRRSAPPAAKPTRAAKPTARPTAEARARAAKAPARAAAKPVQLRWKPVEEAIYYRLRVRRDGAPASRIELEVFTPRPQATVPRSWKRPDGKPARLVPGRYRWAVYSVLAANFGEGDPSARPVAQGTFVVRR